MRPLDLSLWLLYALFLAAAVAVGWTGTTTALTTPYGAGKLALLGVWLAFLAYSLACTPRESLFATIRKLNALWWGRQIGADLYIGLGLALGLIALNEGSLLPVVAWLLPVLLFANLAVLPYAILHYDQLVARFAGG